MMRFTGNMVGFICSIWYAWMFDDESSVCLTVDTVKSRCACWTMINQKLVVCVSVGLPVIQTNSLVIQPTWQQLSLVNST